MSGVFLNDVYYFPETLQELERRFGLRFPPGRSWYDSRSGLAGYEGQGASTLLPPGLELGGPLPADASRGRTGVFLNGQGQPGRAAGHLQRALADRVRVLGADHPDTLTSRNNLAYAHWTAGDLGR